MILVSCCRCLCPINWSQVLNRSWRRSWSSADRRCSNYIWMIDKFIAYLGLSYIRDLTVYLILLTQGHPNSFQTCLTSIIYSFVKTNLSGTQVVIVRSSQQPTALRNLLFTWRRPQMETFSASLDLCEGIHRSPLVKRSFDVFFDLRLNKQLSKQLWGWWL